MVDLRKYLGIAGNQGESDPPPVESTEFTRLSEADPPRSVHPVKSVTEGKARYAQHPEMTKLREQLEATRAMLDAKTLEVDVLNSRLKMYDNASVPTANLVPITEIAKSLNLPEDYLQKQIKAAPFNALLTAINARDHQVYARISQLDSLQVSLTGTDIWKIFMRARKQYEENPGAFTKEVRDAILATEKVEQLCLALNMINDANTVTADLTVWAIKGLEDEISAREARIDELNAQLQTPPRADPSLPDDAEVPDESPAPPKPKGKPGVEVVDPNDL